MPKCLRIIGWCVSFSVFVSFYLVVVPSEAVECPCDYFAVPPTTECWVDPFTGTADHEFFSDLSIPPKITEFCTLHRIEGPGAVINFVVGISDAPPPEAGCYVTTGNVPSNCSSSQQVFPMTPEQFEACQCELAAYAAALNAVDGIEVSGGPPYECSPVVCTSPIPTLNQWGMIITAGVLGLFAVIALFVMRRRRTVAGARGPEGAPQ
jgi:hypothetical protein